MKKLSSILIICFLSISCSKVTVFQVLDAAYWSVSEACSQEWLTEDVCTFTVDSIDLARAFDPNATEDQKKVAAIKILVDSENKLPLDSRARPYLDFAIIALKNL